MSDPSPPRRVQPRNRALSDEAIDWLVRLGGQDADADLRARFDLWLARSPAHAEALREALTILEATGHTRAASDWRDLSHALRRPVLNRRVLLGGSMAAAMAGAVVYGSLNAGLFGPAAGVIADYATAKGERRRIGLPDGSVLWLNTASAVSVDFARDARRLRLHAGEALFEVAADALRPFTVHSGRGETEALTEGTMFSARHTSGRSDIVAGEGQIRVRHASRSVVLMAGQQLSYGADILGAALPADLTEATAWRRGKLIFNRKALSEVATEIERYGRGRIMVVGSDLRAMRVSGVFDLNDLDTALEVIGRTTGSRITHLPLLKILRQA